MEIQPVAEQNKHIRKTVRGNCSSKFVYQQLYNLGCALCLVIIVLANKGKS